MWHVRLLHKLESIRITGMMFRYFQNFLSERCICTRVGKTYSSNEKTDVGIPQGSIIAPILFNIIIHDLPKALSDNTHMTQYADDIAIWVNTTLSIQMRMVSHVQKLYQSEKNKLTAYMKENDFELSREKTCLMLFNNGENPKSLPQRELDGQLLNYKHNTKFLGVYLTTKLNWRLHIENVINKTRIQLNVLKNSQYTVLVSGHKKVSTFICIFSQIKTDLWSRGLFFRSNHTPKETAKHR